MKRIFFILFYCVFFVASQIAPVNASEIKKMESAWLNEYEAFPAWYAHEKGKDSKAGYAFDIQIYPTGKRLVGSINSDNWVLGASGLVPALQAIVNKDAYILGVGADETIGNNIYARADSKLFSIKGINPKFPEVYGSADLIRGKTILCPLGTNSHQLLLAWLSILGLEDTDVTIIDTKPSEALRVFQEGLGETVVLWAPTSYQAEELGLKSIASAIESDVTFKTVIFAKQNQTKSVQKDIQQFMTIYLDSVAEIQAMNVKDAARLYQKFQKQYGIDISMKNATRTISEQKLYAQDAQTFELSNQKSSFFKTLQSNIDFYAYINALRRKDVDFLEDAEYIMQGLSKKKPIKILVP